MPKRRRQYGDYFYDDDDFDDEIDDEDEDDEDEDDDFDDDDDEIDDIYDAPDVSDYEDYEEFLESRCFPRSRDKMKLQLKELELPFYDPLLIIQRTEGRMEEDEFWIRIER